MTARQKEPNLMRNVIEWDLNQITEDLIPDPIKTLGKKKGERFKKLIIELRNLDFSALEASKELTPTEMMLIVSNVYDFSVNQGIQFPKDPMLTVGQLFNILHKWGFRFARIDTKNKPKEDV